MASEQHPWKRGGDDWQREMDRAIVRLEDEVQALSQLKNIVLGNQAQHEFGIETRLHLVERKADKLDMTIEGQPGSPGLRRLLSDLMADLTILKQDLKAIREDRSLKVEVRRDWLTFWAPVIGSMTLFFGSVLLSLDKIVNGFEAVARVFVHHETPAMMLDRLKTEQAGLKNSPRTKEVQKRLADIDATIKRLEGPASKPWQ